jgi:hypothetical protein
MERVHESDRQQRRRSPDMCADFTPRCAAAQLDAEADAEQRLCG